MVKNIDRRGMLILVAYLKVAHFYTAAVCIAFNMYVDGSKRQKRDSSPACASSDGDLRPPQGKRPARELREPYKLRKKLARQRYAPVVRKRKLKGVRLVFSRKFYNWQV